jgi:hypothetical protein
MTISGRLFETSRHISYHLAQVMCLWFPSAVVAALTTFLSVSVCATWNRVYGSSSASNDTWCPGLICETGASMSRSRCTWTSTSTSGFASRTSEHVVTVSRFSTSVLIKWLIARYAVRCGVDGWAYLSTNSPAASTRLLNTITAALMNVTCAIFAWMYKKTDAFCCHRSAWIYMSLKIAQKEEGAIVEDTHSARHCSVSRRFDIKQVFLDLRVRVLERAIHFARCESKYRDQR